jgi:hypothetical protein
MTIEKFESQHFARDFQPLIEFRDRLSTQDREFFSFLEEPEKIVDKSKFHVLIAKEDKIIGYGHLAKFPQEVKKHVRTLGVAVDPNYRQQKIGTQIIQQLIDDARRDNVKKIWLSVHSGNEKAIGLYKKFGFVIEGVFKKEEFRQEYIDILSMALFLETL